MKKNTLAMLSKKLMMTSVAACTLAAVIVSSCTKSPNGGSTTNYATQFAGTWNITSSTCPTNTGATLVLSAGSGSNTLTSSGTVGNTGCVKAVTTNGTASANSFSFPSQTFTDGCGLSYTITYMGTLSGNTLTATETVSGAVNVSCTVTATK